MDHTPLPRFAMLVLLGWLSACAEQEAPPVTAASWEFERIGTVRAAELDEISGLAALPGGGFVVHNDDGPPLLFVIAADGTLRARIAVEDAHLQDWEDLAILPAPGGPLLVIGDIGDNPGTRQSIRLYFVALPEPDIAGAYPRQLRVRHALRLRYPDGPRDAEALAYDPAAKRLLLISKRDPTPRIYGVDAALAMAHPEAVLEFLGELPSLRPPDPIDLLRDPLRGAWVSQPTGLDISADGRHAAVITYRSLYLFERQDDEDWIEAMQRAPREIRGPPGTYEEAVCFDPAGHIVVTTENLPAPLFQLARPAPDQPSSRP